MYKETLKGKASAFILLSVMWSLFSGLGLLDWLDTHRSLSLDPNTLPDLVVWGLHLLFISLALHYTRAERPKPTLCVGEGFWVHIAAHACGWALFANVPLIAFWHGSFIGQALVHGTLLLVALGGFALLQRTEATEAEAEP